MKYLVITCDELVRHNLGHYTGILDLDDSVDKLGRSSVPEWTPTGIVPKMITSYYIPEANRLYDLLRYTGIGWIKTYDDAIQ